jgi:hypothetical protein
MAGIGRLGPHHAALTLEAFQHRGFLAADVGPAAHPHVQVEVQRRAKDAVAEPPSPLGDFDGSSHCGDGIGVFGPDVDVALGGADGVGRDRHALDEQERIALHHHPVGEGAAVALRLRCNKRTSARQRSRAPSSI